MPNRIIKDSIRTSKNVNNMTDFQFRLWVYLITYVDDYGRGSADAELLKGFVFPRRKGVTESTIEKALADLANSGLILLYEVDGEPYFCFPNWSEHQRIQTKKSKYPAPENANPRCVTVSHGESPPESESNPNTNPNPNTRDSAHTHEEFIKPTLEEVKAYCAERKNNIDPEKFIAHYNGNGWKVGKVDMQDWKAAVISWEKNGIDKPKTTKSGTKAATSFDVDDAVKKAMRRSYES